MLGSNGGLSGGLSADLTEVAKTYGMSESRLLLFALFLFILIVVVFVGLRKRSWLMLIPAIDRAA